MPSTVRNALLWIFDAFADEESYLRKPMFGFDAAYIDGKMCLVAADKDAPWSGLLICTAREHHDSMIADIPALSTHPVLGKWLYISQDNEDFEKIAARLTTLVRLRDHRIGVEPSVRRPRSPRQG